ncbi:MAG: hypothetical protein Q4F43_10275, partial [Eubacteriales bacterium]|nr:hypothetical protein [Eubacteriales bacterium]
MKGKRALAILISLVLTVGMLTVGTFAAEGEGNPVNNNTPTEEGGQQEGGQEKNQEPENTPPAQEKEEDPCKDGHDYVLDQSQSVQATCTSDGVNVYVCSRCGDSKKEPGDQALGHQYDEGVVTKEPTEDKEGVKTFTCIRGDDSYTEPIPKLEKKESDPVPESSNLSIGFDVITNDSGKVDAGKGSIEYKYEHKGKGDKEKVTLTLKKATLKANENKGQTQAPAAAIYYAGNGTLVLSLKDENTVTGLTYAICAPNATIQIKTEEKDASLTAKAAPQDSNAIRGKKIDLDKSLGITDPENAYIFEGQNDDRSTYETVTFNNNGHNQAATSVTIQIPEIKVIYTDGAGNEKTDKVRKGDDCKLADCDFDAPEDQEFDHWEIAGESYDAGDEVEITEETTVTAVWKVKEPEV